MKTKITQNLKSIILALILVAGVSYVSAYSTWSDPTAAAPGNNADAPINTGGGTSGHIYSQSKTGLFTIDHMITGDMTVTNSNGTVTGIPDGAIMIADGANTGKVKWAGKSLCAPSSKSVNSLYYTNASHTQSNDYYTGQADIDGFIVASADITNKFAGYVGDTAAKVIIPADIDISNIYLIAVDAGGTSGNKASITFPVPKNYYWSIASSATLTANNSNVFWIPMNCSS
jgi:hypothetical protein